MTRDTVYYNQVFRNQLRKSYLNNKFKTYLKCRFIIVHLLKVMCLPDFATEFVKFLEFLISSKNCSTNRKHDFLSMFVSIHAL